MQQTKRSLAIIITHAYFDKPMELLTPEEFAELGKWVDEHTPWDQFDKWKLCDPVPEEFRQVMDLLVQKTDLGIHPREVVHKVWERYSQEDLKRTTDALCLEPEAEKSPFDMGLRRGRQFVGGATPLNDAVRRGTLKHSKKFGSEWWHDPREAKEQLGIDLKQKS